MDASPVYRDRPGPSSSARPKTTQKRSLGNNDEEQSEEVPRTVENKAEVTYWRHIGKQYAIDYYPWLDGSALVFACRWDSPDPPEDLSAKTLVEFLDESNIKYEVRVTKTFQSEVCFFVLSANAC